MKFELNKRGMDKLIKAIDKEAVKEGTKRTQKVIDSVERTHRGKPVPEVKTRLRSVARQAGWECEDKELDPLAEAISAGTHIKVEPKRT